MIQSPEQHYPTAFDIYLKALELDEWPGNEGDLQFGTSNRAGMKALRHFGFISEFYRIFTVDDMARWLGGVDVNKNRLGGPLVIGINWYDTMYEVNPKGFFQIGPNADLAGGHSMCVDLWNQEKGYFGGPNSWGTSFGKPYQGNKSRLNGRWLMWAEDMERLMHEDGDCWVAKEIRAKPATT